jgi:hypothetical protein
MSHGGEQPTCHRAPGRVSRVVVTERVVPSGPAEAQRAGRDRASISGAGLALTSDMIRFDIEEPACRLVAEPDASPDAPGVALPRALRDVIDGAEREPGPDGAGRCWVRCEPTEARALGEHFERVAAALQLRGDYDASTACAQTAEKIRRALAGHPRA